MCRRRWMAAMFLSFILWFALYYISQDGNTPPWISEIHISFRVKYLNTRITTIADAFFSQQLSFHIDIFLTKYRADKMSEEYAQTQYFVVPNLNNTTCFEQLQRFQNNCYVKALSYVFCVLSFFFSWHTMALLRPLNVYFKLQKPVSLYQPFPSLYI